MLEPLRGAPKKRRFTVYDLEWWPGTYELRLVGVYDKERGYRSYITLKEFFRCELTRRNSARPFYAHFGGSSDILFLIQYVMARMPWADARAIFAGSSAVIFRLSTGERSNWTFIDSGYLIRRPLRDIGAWLGLAKGDKSVIYSENLQEVRDYNERDCEILYNAIERLQEQTNALGGELRATLASTALDLFRRRYLSRTILTGEAINELARPAYIASRVEPFRRECPAGEYFDVNSSFPFSMTSPQPGEVLGRGRRLPEPGRGALYLAKARVRVPDCYLPPLAWRAPEGRVLFPVGEWESTFDSCDIELLLSTGGQVMRVDEVTTFAPFSDLAEYVRDLYAKRLAATGYEKEVFKLFLNGLYGKFGERSEKKQILFRPDKTTCQHSTPCPDDDPCIEMVAPDIYALKERKEIAHAHVPISAHITSLSRRLLFNYMAPCKVLYYCDTDSLVCAPSDATFDVTAKLGGLKHEYSISEGTFLAPKLYSFRKSDGGQRVTRAKGFPGTEDIPGGGRQLDYKSFCSLAEGKDLQLSRMQRIRESLRTDGTVTPRDEKISKRIYLTNTKRCHLPSGDSRPWTVDEVSAVA